MRNPFSNRNIHKNSKTFPRVKYFKSLRKLNKTNLKIPNPNGGKSILVFGPSHLYYIDNNFSLNEQNKIIENFKKTLDREVSQKEIQIRMRN